MIKPSDFKVGEVYKMDVARRSHVKHPYYVIIDAVDDYFIVTKIPEKDCLQIKYSSPEWDYHIPRMTLIGSDSNAKKLIHNQPNLI